MFWRNAPGGFVAGLLAGVLLVSIPARADLDDYVGKPEAAFAWKLREKRAQPEGMLYELHLTSQTWQGIVWEHRLQIFQAANTPPNSTMVLSVTGGSAKPMHALLGLEMARTMKAPVAFLYNIPNQPLFEGKFREDALVAETFLRYLSTKDENWPLLFPMVKSVVKAMDVLQAFSQQEWNQPVTKFIVSGASKRGWTAWLTAAADARVKAIAPLVIDTLNMRAQMPRQLESFGRYSDRISPYTKRALVPLPETPEGIRLWNMVDPWVYRDKLTLPKLIINGSNDPYWTTDALNLYWDDLKGDKWVLYIPNAGHNLRQQDKHGLDQFAHAANSLAAFVRHQIEDKPFPKLTWKHDDADGRLRLAVESNPPPLDARLWVAAAPTKDFRLAKWTERAANITENKVLGEITPPSEGYVAFYGELDYEVDGIKYHLSTQIRVAGKVETRTE